MAMNTKKITKQALDFQKGTFTCWYNTMSSLQDQTGMAVDKMLNQTSWIPDEDRQVISSWVGTCKNERDRYKAYVEESFSVLEKHLARNTKDAPDKPDKPAAEAKTAAPMMTSQVDAVEENRAPDAQETTQSIQ